MVQISGIWYLKGGDGTPTASQMKKVANDCKLQGKENGRASRWLFPFSFNAHTSMDTCASPPIRSMNVHLRVPCYYLLFLPFSYSSIGPGTGSPSCKEACCVYAPPTRTWLTGMWTTVANRLSVVPSRLVVPAIIHISIASTYSA